jgi:hypothetical protein
MNTRNHMKWVFWVGLALFLSWDWIASPPIDLRMEPPAIALGSGQAPSGGHCAIAK